MLSLETVYPSEQRVDKPRIESAVREILLAIGENPDREGLKGTPGRVAEAYELLFSGLAEDPAVDLSAGFQEEYGKMVLIRDIPFSSICDHHFLPIVGKPEVADRKGGPATSVVLPIRRRHVDPRRAP